MEMMYFFIVLKAIESALLRNRTEAELMTIVKDMLFKYLPFSSTIAFKQGADVDTERRKDHISHYILRLAYCRRCALRIPDS